MRAIKKPYVAKTQLSYDPIRLSYWLVWNLFMVIQINVSIH